MSSKTFKPKAGPLQIKTGHKWVDYDFKTTGVYFHYFKSGKEVGKVFKNQVKTVKPTDKKHKVGDYCFEVHHSASGSPWILSATTQEDCIQWMECLQPGSSSQLKAPAPSEMPPSSQYPPSSPQYPPSSMQYPPTHQGYPQSQMGYPPVQMGYQQHPGAFSGNSLHESLNMASFRQQLHPNTPYNGDALNHSFTGGQIGAATIQQPTSTMRPPPQSRLTHSVPTDMSREQFMNQSMSQQRGSVPNDYVQLPTIPSTAEKSEEPPLIVGDHQLPSRVLGRSSTFPARGPSSYMYQQQPQHQEYAQPVSPKPQGQNIDTGYVSLRPPLVTRATMPLLQTQLSEDQYIPMNGGNSPSPANVYERPHRPNNPVQPGGVPPRPPTRPLHTLSTEDMSARLDSCDGNYYEQMTSPNYVDPKELNPKNQGEEEAYSPPPPLPAKPDRNTSGSDDFRYFSTEQVRMLAEMFKQVAGMKEGEGSPVPPRRVKKQLSSTDLNTVLRKTSAAIPDQILDQDDQYIVGQDYSSRKWARAPSIPHHKPLDNLADNIDDPIYQMQKDAFTISKESLSDFKKIGKGQYGEVQSALYRPSPGSAPIKVAVKKTKESCSPQEKENFLKEIVVMAQFMHPNIVRVFGSVDQGGPCPWLVLEYLANGDLKAFLKHNHRPVHRLVKYMVDIAMGMHYLSEKGFVHRDLAARNIFMDENELCKVGDFGLLRETSKREEDGENLYILQSSLALPARWMAVESITDQIFSSASDVWSFGVLMWELFNPGVRPYKTADNMAVIAQVSAGIRLEIPEKCPKTVGQVMQACWNADYTKRPSFLVIANILCRCIQQDTTRSSNS
ncbi:uncharacterized protein [Dysidea avara]